MKKYLCSDPWSRPRALLAGMIMMTTILVAVPYQIGKWRESEERDRLDYKRGEQRISAATNLGQDINEIQFDGFPWLSYAVGVSWESHLVKPLLDAGADPNIEDENGWYPIHYAAQRCDPKIIKVLLDAGADPHKQNGVGQTAFEVCEATAGRGDKNQLRCSQSIQVLGGGRG